MIKPKNFHWITSAFLTITFLLAVSGLFYYIPRFGIHPLEPLVCGLFVFVVAMVVSGGYHRYFAHKSFVCHPVLKAFYLIIGAAAFQQSALVWAVDHRMHHRFVDTEQDPYNINKGFWYAHIGWLFNKAPSHRENVLALAPDLAKDPWVMWQHKYWLLISLPLAFGVPLLIGFLIGRPVGMLLWAGILRIVITHQTTFTINSIAHKFGTQPYTDKNSARDVWWLAPFLCGENYHNYHHRFQSDYRNGIRWYHYDPTKWALWIFSKIHLVKGLRRAPDLLVLKARLEMDLKTLEKKMKPASKEFWHPFQIQLQQMRSSLEEAAELYANTKQNYMTLKKDLESRSKESLLKMKLVLKEKKKVFRARLFEWKQMINLSFENSLISS